MCIVFNFQNFIDTDAKLCHPFSRYSTNMSNEILENIMNIQPKDSAGGGGETRESIVYRLADDMLEKLPEDYIAFEVSFVYNEGTINIIL